MDAGVALLRERPERALRLLDSAVPLLEASQAKLVLASAHYCRGALLGGEQGAALKRGAWQAIADEGVVEPWRYIVSFASGFRGVVGRSG
jgi:hypothetical protein